MTRPNKAAAAHPLCQFFTYLLTLPRPSKHKRNVKFKKNIWLTLMPGLSSDAPPMGSGIIAVLFRSQEVPGSKRNIIFCVVWWQNMSTVRGTASALSLPNRMNTSLMCLAFLLLWKWLCKEIKIANRFSVTIIICKCKLEFIPQPLGTQSMLPL